MLIGKRERLVAGGETVTLEATLIKGTEKKGFIQDGIRERKKRRIKKDVCLRGETAEESISSWQ